jgi:O-antigen/teichoic acid export membrane protein
MAGDPDTRARNRYLLLALVRVAGAVGAIFGLVLLARAHTTGPRILGMAIVIAALLMIGSVQRSLARRWRSPRK